MYNRYFIEYLGTLVIMTSKLLTDAHPVVMGIVYFSVYWTTRGISTGYFIPFGPLAAFMLGRGEYSDMIYNFAAQFAGAISAIFLFKPLKAFIE